MSKANLPSKSSTFIDIDLGNKALASLHGSRSAPGSARSAKSARSRQDGTPREVKLSRRFSEIDYENLIREEFFKLHRQYRRMEDTRRAIAAQQGKSLSKSHRLIQVLEEEKYNLEADVPNAESPQTVKRDEEAKRVILALLEDFEMYRQDIKYCWSIIAETEANVDKISKKLVEQQLKVQKIYGEGMSLSQVAKKKEILENKLYHVKTQFNLIMVKNRELREEIRIKLRERGHFFSRYIYAKQRMNHERTRMMDLILKASEIYDMRDDYVSKTKALFLRNEKENKVFNQEIKEFNRLLQHDIKLEMFMETKNKLRRVLESAAERTYRKFAQKLREIDNRLKEYMNSFQTVLEMTNNSGDVNQLIHDFHMLEQRNFQHFKDLSELNHEICFIFNNIKDLIENIDVLYHENKVRNKERKMILSELEESLNHEKKDLNNLLEKWGKTETEMNDFIEQLDKIFNEAECNKAPIVRLLGNLNGISPRNAVLCMRILEHRIDDLIFERDALELRKNVELKGGPIPVAKKGLPVYVGVKGKDSLNKGRGGPFKPRIYITGNFDVDDADEEDKNFSREPISYEDMKAYLQDKLKQARLENPSFIGMDLEDREGDVRKDSNQTDEEIRPNSEDSTDKDP